MTRQLPHILVVDDDVLVVRIVELALSSHGYQITTAGAGDEGLQKAHDLRPDLVVLDVMMPGALDGYDVCRRLKTNPLTADIRVVMLTARGGMDEKMGETADFSSNLEDRVQGYRAGADDFLSKPVRVKELLKRVEALL